MHRRLAALLAASADNPEPTAPGPSAPKPTTTPTDRQDPTVLDVTGGTADLRIDSAAGRFLKLAGLGLTATGDARERDGRLHFPVSGGQLSLQAGKSRIELAGDLRLTARDRHVDATRLIVRLTERVVTAEVRGRRVPLLRLEGDVPRALPIPGDSVDIATRASVVGETVVAELGQWLDVDALTRGLPLGTLRVTAET
jgi:hypothetical protein